MVREGTCSSAVEQPVGEQPDGPGFESLQVRSLIEWLESLHYHQPQACLEFFFGRIVARNPHDKSCVGEWRSLETHWLIRRR